MSRRWLQLGVAGAVLAGGLVLAQVVPQGGPVPRPDRGPDGAGVAHAASLDRPQVARDDKAAIRPGCGGAETIEQANAAFGFRLLREVAGEDDEANALISPLSGQLALQMLANGATDDTWEPLLLSMCLQGRSVREANAANRDLLAALRDSGNGVEFRAANAIWTNDDLRPRPALVGAVREWYDGMVATFDTGDPAGSARAINGWIDEATKHRIPEVVTPDDIAPPGMLMVMFLANALTFDGTWHTEFDEADSFEGTFAAASGDDVETTYLNVDDEFEYNAIGEDEDQQGLEAAWKARWVGARLPYGKSRRFAMHVIVPTGKRTPEDVLDWLGPRTWREWTDGYEKTDVNVTIPKMEVATTHELLEPLERLGMPRAAYDELVVEDLGNPVEIVFVRQKAWMEVDERGTKAAAATVVGAGVMAGFDSGPSVTADRPYVLVLEDSKTGAILFAGVINDPTA